MTKTFKLYVPGHFEIKREAPLGRLGDSRQNARLLRPDVLFINHHKRTITPVEFTFPDDGRLMQAESGKRTKYEKWLETAPSPRLATTGASYTYRPLHVFAMGVFGCVAPATDRALAVMGIADDNADAVLIKVAVSLARRSAQIVRLRFANAGSHRPL